jgi:hypothetical protein
MNAISTTSNPFEIQDDRQIVEEGLTFIFVDDATYEFVGGGMAANGV